VRVVFDININIISGKKLYISPFLQFMMKDYYKEIKEHFQNKEFTISNICEVLDVAESTAYSIIKRMKKRNLIISPVRGIFVLSNPKKISIPSDINMMRNHLLETITRTFSFTGLSILEPFLHHIPFVSIYHLFVEPGSAEDFKEKVKHISKVVVLIEPSLNDIHLILDKIDAKKVVIIRENKYFYASKKGLHSKEGAFVDLYFEVTREKIPFIRGDVDEIFKSLVLNNLINFSHLFKYANERGIKNEIKEYLTKIAEDIEIPKKALK
jgi:hypothetical protein